MYTTNRGNIVIISYDFGKVYHVRFLYIYTFLLLFFTFNLEQFFDDEFSIKNEMRKTSIK